MFRKPRSIQSLLSIYFILFAFFLLGLIVSILTWFQYRSARNEAVNTLRQLSVSVADSVDQQINQMSQITLNAISSTSMQDEFASYLAGSPSAYERNQQRTRLAGQLTIARGLDFSIRQVNIYAPPGRGSAVSGYGVGEYYGVLPTPADALPWYEDVKQAGGRLVIIGPDETLPEDTSSGAQRRNARYLTVCRMFYNNQHVPAGFLEVRKYYDDVFSLAESTDLPYQAAVYVYDSNGRQLFPETAGAPEDGQPSYFSRYTQAVEDGQDVQDTFSEGPEYVNFAASSSGSVVIAAVAQRSVFTSQIFRILMWTFIIFLLLLLVAFLVALPFSRRLSSPIRALYHFLSDEKKDRFEPLVMEETGIREIDKLTASINENIRATKSASDTMLALKEREVQAQMLAMQAQMNPHFLYNSLSTVGEMAEEGLTEPVAQMCREITEIMRYISSNREQRAPLQEELEICDMYLDCIRMRYGDDLISKIEVPDEMLDLQIPKLCTQLLVENAVRSVTTRKPPWEVTIHCETRDGNWYVTVSDNGPGFDPEVDKNLRAQMDQILETGTLPSLKIQGMGILNIFIRLYLLDGIPFIFDMGNRPQGGAFVTIGGSLRKE